MYSHNNKFKILFIELLMHKIKLNTKQFCLSINGYQLYFFTICNWFPANLCLTDILYQLKNFKGNWVGKLKKYILSWKKKNCKSGTWTYELHQLSYLALTIFEYYFLAKQLYETGPW